MTYTNIYAGTPFESMDIRKRFVSKVYSIVFAQLLLTSLIILPFVISASAKYWAFQHIYLAPLLSILGLAIILALGCIPGLSRNVPINYMLLAAFTALEGFSIAFVVAGYDSETVFFAVVITCVVFGALTFYAAQTSSDYTTLGAILFAALFALLGFGFLTILVPSRVGTLIYLVVGVLLFCGYIVVDTQLIMGGKGRQVEFSPEDYIAAAISLYLDVVNLFLFLLQLLGERQRE